MATTWQKAIHRSNSGSITAALRRTIEYVENPEKTDGGELIAAYGCDPATCEAEFLLSKKLYEHNTGRNQGAHDVIGYQVRQSFKPGEVTAAEALKIGYDLAMRWTKGRHQFIVTAHTNTDNPHTHIFFNSVNLENDRKFADFKRSAIVLRRVSDQICLENGLSIIEKPKLSKGNNRAAYLGENKPPTGRDSLRKIIDANIAIGRSLTDFFIALKQAGVELKGRSQISYKPPGSKKFFRQDSLGAGYSQEAILERLAGTRTVEKSNADAERKAAEYTAERLAHSSEYTPSLLIDIQQKIREGKGGGYEHWAHIFNIQQMSKTLMFLKEQGIDSYDDLVKASAAASADFHKLTESIKPIESRLKEISELQKQIGTYGKTRDTYKAYVASGKSVDFYEAHRSDIALHQAAKNYFSSLNLKPLPKMADLKQEYAALAAEKKKLYGGYHELKQKSRELLTARQNVEMVIGVKQPPQKSRNAHEL